MLSILTRYLLLVSLFLLLLSPAALAKTLLYVPFDDRPVSLEYPAATVRAAGYEILVPPARILSGLNREGDPEALWSWVMANASQADAVVVSADALLYGGLVDSRTHEYGPAMLEWRFNQFSRLKQAHPQIPLYIFSTIMRSPQASAGALEPSYYKKFGGEIYQYMALQEKAELEGLTGAEKQRQAALLQAIPKDVLADWMERREKNFINNRKLVDLTRNHVVEFLIMGRDDTSYYSRSHTEWRMLNEAAGNLIGSQYLSFPGADQLGLLLLTRACNTLTGHVPTVAVHYALGSEAATIPRYEDQPFGETIRSHILAAGGRPIADVASADLVLAVNTPLTAVTEEAESVDNFPVITDFTRQFVTFIATRLSLGQPVAVADVAFANGADNSLLAEIHHRRLLDKLSAYSGWNTASNTLGYAISQGILSHSMNDRARKSLLAVRYLDDWAYQANIRPGIYRSLPDTYSSNLRYLSPPTPEAERLTRDQLRAFASNYLWVRPDSITVSFPWDRLFEIGITIKQE